MILPSSNCVRITSYISRFSSRDFSWAKVNVLTNNIATNSNFFIVHDF